ncbi:hypothetical protein FRX31_035095 [Thalictrum thalictroides]|uniref:Uncharacterized protein n=1 Tax=Thalictrum thalictroides TaxID=46969 RepID=A0A7J6URV7_THATH|nr:hypothetical protein FRX31_035095 [Thalictrum thalictroides]
MLMGVLVKTVLELEVCLEPSCLYSGHTDKNTYNFTSGAELQAILKVVLLIAAWNGGHCFKLF